MAWVYIIQTKNEQFYVGSTVDIDKRLKQHQQNHTATTARLGVKQLLLKQEFATLEEARSVEYKIKNLKRKDYIEKMIEQGYIRIKP